MSRHLFLYIYIYSDCAIFNFNFIKRIIKWSKPCLYVIKSIIKRLPSLRIPSCFLPNISIYIYIIYIYIYIWLLSGTDFFFSLKDGPTRRELLYVIEHTTNSIKWTALVNLGSEIIICEAVHSRELKPVSSLR